MTRIVISQPMFSPWVGLFEQINLADVYVHLDDVQMPLGRSFINRVQIKTSQGQQWLTVPIQRNGTQKINQILIDDVQNWRSRHLNSLTLNYNKTPFFNDMIDIIYDAYNENPKNLSELNIKIIESISDYYRLNTHFVYSSQLNISSGSSKRLMEIIKYFGGDTYITGHGAKNYLDHEMFEDSNVRVEYMNYQMEEYAQLHGAFNPFVSSLDLIANEGRKGGRVISSSSVYWREFLDKEIK